MIHVCKIILCLFEVFFTHKEISSEVFDLSFTVMMMMMIHLCNTRNEVCLRTYCHVNILRNSFTCLCFKYNDPSSKLSWEF